MIDFQVKVYLWQMPLIISFKLNTIDSDPFIHRYQTLLNIESKLLKTESMVAKNMLSKETWKLDELTKVPNKSILPNLRKILNFLYEL